MNIKTVRCVITKLKPTDFKEAINLFIDERVRQYLGGAINEEATLKKLTSWVNSENEFYFCVRLSEHEDFVGIISVTEYHDNFLKELSYQILPKFWGMGIAYESIAAILDFLKNNTEINELVAETQSRNLKSCRILGKLGFELINTVIRFGEEQSVYKRIL